MLLAVTTYVRCCRVLPTGWCGGVDIGHWSRPHPGATGSLLHAHQGPGTACSAGHHGLTGGPAGTAGECFGMLSGVLGVKDFFSN
jgi:hypothetical protein